MANKTVIKILSDNGLKITPQRVAVLEVVMTLQNHPTADNIVDYIRIIHPSIAMGTIYRSLSIFNKKGIISIVKTGKDIVRYDAVKNKHHHLYCADSERIEDYFDEELDSILLEYLKKKKIADFRIEDFKLQIVGKFTDSVKDKTRQ